MEDVFGSMQEFVTSQSNFFDCEDQRLCDEVSTKMLFASICICVFVCLCVYVSGCLQDNSKSERQIFLNILSMGGSWT